MVVYLVLAAFPMFLGCLYPNLQENKRKKIQFYTICGLIMLLIMGLRHYSLGSTDTLNYYNAMRRAIASPSWESFYNPDYFEGGSQLFIFIISRIFKDPQWLLVITSLIYIVSVFYFVEHNSDDIPLSITVYITLGLYMFNMQGMRQSLAMCVCLFAFEQAKCKRLIRFLILVALAIAFHQTAILFLPVYIICQMKFSGKNIGIMLVLTALGMFLSNRIVMFANLLFEKSYTNIADSGGYVSLAIYVLLVTVLLFLDIELREKKDITSLLYVLIIGMACYIFRYVGARMAERVSFYFAFSQLALLPRVSRMVVKEQQNLARILIFVLALLFFAYRLNGSDFVPYKFFWQI